MGKFVIKKPVSLDFLGDDYKDDVFVFRGMTVKEFEEYTGKIETAKDDNKQALKLILEALKTHLLEGKIGEEEFKPEDFDDFDIAAILELFKRFTGQEISPKG